MTNYWKKRQYFEDSTEVADLAKRGRILLISATFTVTSPGTVSLALTTGEVPAQIAFYDIATATHPVSAVLIEGPSGYTGTASSIVPRNLNRNYPDTTSLVLENAATPAGGVEIASEYVGTGAKAGGSVSLGAKIHTLKANETYIMSFTNEGNQTTKVHLNLGMVEDPPIPPSLIDAA